MQLAIIVTNTASMSINRKEVDTYMNRVAIKFGREIKTKRESLNISRSELSRRSLVSITWLKDVESGRKMPSYYVIVSISMALNYSNWRSISLDDIEQPTYGFDIEGSTMVLSHIEKNV